MTIKLNGSTDGSVSLQAPADTSPTGTDITLTLPTTAGSADQFVKNSGTAGTLEYSSMVETSTGIGLGTSSPFGKLHIEDTSSDLELFLIGPSAGSSRIRFGDTDDSNIGQIIYDNTSDSLQIHANNAERMRIDSSGNVGIGTVSPISKLSVTSANRLWSVTGDETNYVNTKATSSDGSVTTFHRHIANRHHFNVGDGTTQAMYIDSTGNVVFGTSSPTQIVAGTHNGKFYQASDTNLISCRATSSSATHQSFFNSNGGVGSITTNASGTNYNSQSDYRLKENVVDLDGAIDRVKQLAPKRFNFIVDADTTVDGFLAHEAQTVVPEAVTGTHNEVDDDGNPVMQGIDQSKLVPLLTAALQEAIAKIETLETKVAALEAGS